MDREHANEAFTDVLNYLSKKDKHLNKYKSEFSKIYTTIGMYYDYVQKIDTPKELYDKALALNDGNSEAIRALTDYLINHDFQPSPFVIPQGKDKSDIITSDLPPTKDILDFYKYTDTFVEMIIKGNLETPITIGVHGDWGSGKTTLMKLIERNLRKHHSIKVKTVWFNAWRYRKEENLWRALILLILNSIEGEEGLSPYQQEELDDIRTRLSRSIEKEEIGDLRVDVPNLMKAGIQLAVPKVEVLSKSYEAIQEVYNITSKDVTQGKLEQTSSILQRETTKIYMDRISSVEDFYEQFEYLIRKYVRKTMVVFIDDLDRCMPEKAIEVLEAIKLFLDVKGCIFFIGMDNAVIEKGIELIYRFKEKEREKEKEKEKDKGEVKGVGKEEEREIESPITGEKYIDKIIQVPFTIPALTDELIEGYMRELLDVKIDDHGDPISESDFEKTQCIDIINLAMIRNPRKIKKVLNILKLLKRVRDRSIDPNVPIDIDDPHLTKFLIIKHSWSRFFREWEKNPVMIEEIETLLDWILMEREMNKNVIKYLDNKGIRLDIPDYIPNLSFIGSGDLTDYGYGTSIESIYAQESMASNKLFGHQFDKDTDSREDRNRFDVPGDLSVLKHVNDRNAGLIKFLFCTNQYTLGEISSDLFSLTRTVDPNASKEGSISVGEQTDVLLGDDIYDAKMGAFNARNLDVDDRYSLIEILLASLGSRLSEDRVKAAKALGEIQADEAIDPLCTTLLNDKNEDVKVACANALGEIGSENAVWILMDVLEDSKRKYTSEVRSAAANALGQIGSKVAEDLLIQVLENEPTAVRHSAVKALMWIGTRKAVDGLIKALNDKYGNVRRDASKALGYIGSTEAVPALCTSLVNDRFSEVREAAAEGLGNIGDMSSVDALLQMIGDGDKRVRRAVVEALGLIGSRKAVEPLLKVLTDKDSIARMFSVTALGRLRSEKAIPELVEGTSDSELCGYAIEALGKIGFDEGVKPLATVLKKEIDNSSLRLKAAEALGMLRSHEAVVHLLDALDEKDSQVMIQLVKSLGRTGDERAVGALCKLSKEEKEEIRLAAIEALGRIGGEEAKETILEHFKNPSLRIRSYAAWAAGLNYDKKFERPLIKILETEEDQSILTNAIQSLGSNGVKDAEDAIISIINKSTDSNVLVDATWALDKIVTKEDNNKAIEEVLLNVLMNSNYSEVRANAAGVLGNLGMVNAKGQLIKAMKNDAPNVIKSALLSLGQLKVIEEVDSYISLLTHESFIVRRCAITTLTSFNWGAIQKKVDSKLDEINDRGPKDPSYAIGLASIAAIKTLNGDVVHGNELFKLAMKTNPGNYDIMMQKLAVASELGDMDLYQDICQIFIQFFPNDAMVLNARGWMMGLIGDLVGAIEHVNKALEKDEKNLNILGTKGFILGKIGNYNEAMKYHEWVLRFAKGDPANWYELASTQIQNGQYKLARMNIEKGKKIDPDEKVLLKYRSEFEDVKEEEIDRLLLPDDFEV